MIPDKREVEIFWGNFKRVALTFFLWALFVTLGFELYPEFLKGELQRVVFESFSIRTMAIIFILMVFLVGFFMLAFGKVSDDVGVKGWVYRRLIVAPSWFGVSFYAVAFGVSWGVAVSAFLWGYRDAACELMLSTVVFLFGAALMAYLPILAKPGSAEVNENMIPRLTGGLLIVASVFVVFIVYPKVFSEDENASRDSFSNTACCLKSSREVA